MHVDFSVPWLWDVWQAGTPPTKAPTHTGHWIHCTSCNIGSQTTHQWSGESFKATASSSSVPEPPAYIIRGLGHLSIRLLWSQQLSIMFFQLAVLTVISQLYQSSIDQLQELWKLWIKLWLAIQWHLSFFSWDHVYPEFLTWLVTYLQHT
jgi:hypothetical protein